MLYFTNHTYLHTYLKEHNLTPRFRVFSVLATTPFSLSAQKEKKLNFTSIYPNLSRKTLRSPQYDIKAGPNQEFKVSVMFSHAVSSTSAPLIPFSGFAGTKQRV